MIKLDPGGKVDFGKARYYCIIYYINDSVLEDLENPGSTRGRIDILWV